MNEKSVNYTTPSIYFRCGKQQHQIDGILSDDFELNQTELKFSVFFDTGNKSFLLMTKATTYKEKCEVFFLKDGKEIPIISGYVSLSPIPRPKKIHGEFLFISDVTIISTD